MATMEQLFEALRKADAAGDAENARRIAQIIQRERSTAAPQSLRYEDKTPEESIDDDYLRADPDWIAASKIVYRKNEGTEFDGSDEEAADYGLDVMGWFNYNLPALALDANSLRNASQQEKEAFLYLMDAYDDLGVSWSGTWRFIKGVAADPTTYVGLSSFGIGTIASQGGKAATKEGVKALLKEGAKAAVVAGIEGAVYTATDETVRQSIEIDAGRREGYDIGQIGTSAGIGAALGGLLGGAVGAGGRAIKNRAGRTLAEETEDILNGSRRTADEASGASSRVIPTEAQTPASATPTAKQTPSAGETLVAANDNLGPSITSSPTEASRFADIIKQAANDNIAHPVARASDHLTTIVDTIRGAAKNGPVGVVDNVQSMTALRASTQGLADLLENAAKEGEDLSGYLTRMEVTASQMQVLKNSAHQATDSFKRQVADINKRIQTSKDPKEITGLRQQADELETMLGTVERVDLELSTQSGRDLRMRQEGLSVGDLRGVTVKSLMEEHGYSRGEAELAFNRLVADREAYLRQTGELTEIDTKISHAIKQGDFSEAIKLKAQRKTILGKADKQATQKLSLYGKGVRLLNKVSELVAEIMVSMVFSPSTLIVNTVPSFAKSLYRPLLDAIVRDPFSKAAYKEAVAHYSAMTAMVPTAFRAARAAFKFERNFLLDDINRVLESGPIVPKRWGGGIMRFFPRMLQATDEFFSQVSYRGYVIGRATGQAYEDGISKGLKGKELDAFVRQRTKEVANRAFSKNVSEDERVINILLDQAMDRGLSGGKADAWVRRQLNKRPEVYARAENESGKDYVKDLLFKRGFSGKTTPSALAKGYEGFVRRHPMMRVAGQLFFRTPVRVFEEGIRLTPGINLISPNFMADLAGKNGPLRQVRAQGEALMSYGFAGTIFTLYAQGNITGSGPSDYKQRRQGENTDEFEPYTITLPNGDKWSYRNMDPLATPLKIIVNALERYETLEYRRTQGEMIDAGAFEQALAYVKVGTGAIAQAIRDASLTQGIDQIMDAVELMLSENDTSGQLIKYVGQKFATLLPNTWYKTQLLNSPFVNDPATVDQFLLNRINPSDPRVPHMYTALGRPRTRSNPEAGLMVFSPSTAEERKRGIPEKELEVERALWTMAQAADTSFQAPYKHPFLGNTDLRTRMTKDGKEPLYNRWMRYTHESDMIDVLHRAIVQSNLPYGTPSEKGPRVEVARKILNTYRDAAMVRLMSEETGLAEEFISNKMRQQSLKLGVQDNLNVPFR